MKNYKNKYFKLKKKYNSLEKEFYKILTSRGWKIISILYKFKDKHQQLFKYLRIHNYYNLLKKLIFSYPDKRRLEKILRENGNKTIIIYPPTIDWNIPLFQRPQHLAIELSNQGFLFFYCTSNQYDNISGFKNIKSDLYLTNRYDLLKNIKNKNAWIIIHAAHPTITISEISNLKKDGFKIIYDYVDKIDEKISGKNKLISTRHSSINGKLIDLGLATAKILFKELKSKLGVGKVLYNPNGVNIEHFDPTIKHLVPKDMKHIISANKPIIGYYGALAKWIDYSLLNKIASSKKNWNIVLIGWDFDKSISELKKYSNVHYLGVKNYKELPSYAALFDVAIIPFKKGKIAKSTSPLKLYEYFALQKPVIITRDLIECKNYKGVYHSINESTFIKNIELALSQKNSPYLKNILSEHASKNSWNERARQISNYIKLIQK